MKKMLMFLMVLVVYSVVLPGCSNPLAPGEIVVYLQQPTIQMESPTVPVATPTTVGKPTTATPTATLPVATPVVPTPTTPVLTPTPAKPTPTPEVSFTGWIVNSGQENQEIVVSLQSSTPIYGSIDVITDRDMALSGNSGEFKLQAGKSFGLLSFGKMTDGKFSFSPMQDEMGNPFVAELNFVLTTTEGIEKTISFVVHVPGKSKTSQDENPISERFLAVGTPLQGEIYKPGEIVRMTWAGELLDYSVRITLTALNNDGSISSEEILGTVPSYQSLYNFSVPSDISEGLKILSLKRTNEKGETEMFQSGAFIVSQWGSGGKGRISQTP